MSLVSRWRSVPSSSPMQLENGSRIGVIGGGPAGSFFSYFLLDNAERLDLRLEVDIYEPRDFTITGPLGCNMCGGIVSESLIHCLAAEGIHIPASVLQRGIDSYVLHMDVGSVRIETPLHEKRIAAIHRGAGPRGITQRLGPGLDDFLLHLASSKGARVHRSRVQAIAFEHEGPKIQTQDGQHRSYDLVVSAVGVNSPLVRTFEDLGLSYKPPVSTKTYICEFRLGRELIEEYLGSAMHVFLLNIPRLEFAAIIPKGEFVTVCLLGSNIDKALVQAFLASREVRECMPPGWEAPQDFCRCSPQISIAPAHHPFADRFVFVGDCGSTRLYKDGIGAAYRTAKAAALTAIYDGVSAQDFQRGFWPICAAFNHDNVIGRLMFLATRAIQKSAALRRGMWRMASFEETSEGRPRRMSLVLWDLFTGSAPYTEVFFRTLHPRFLAQFLWQVLAGVFHSPGSGGGSHAGAFGKSLS